MEHVDRIRAAIAAVTGALTALWGWLGLVAERVARNYSRQAGKIDTGWRETGCPDGIQRL